MFTPLARMAMTTETRGQNSWVNYSPVNADLIAKMGELGFFGMSVPEEFGGGGMGNLAMIITTVVFINIAINPESSGG